MGKGAISDTLACNFSQIYTQLLEDDLGPCNALDGLNGCQLSFK